MTDFTGAFFHKTGPGTSSNNQNIGATMQRTGDKLTDSETLGALTGVVIVQSGGGDSDSTPTQVWSDGQVIMAKSRSRLFAELAGGMSTTGRLAKGKMDTNAAHKDDATVNFTGVLQKAGVPVAADANLNSFLGTFSLPTSDGSANQILKTDGSGNLTFVDDSDTTPSFTDLTLTPASLGAAGQVLKVNSGATALEFGDESGGGSGESIVTLKQDGDVTVHTGTARWYAPRDITITDVIMRVDTAPVGSSLNITINRVGTQSGTTDMSIAAAGTKATHTTDFNLDADDYMTVDVTQIGSTTAGADLKVTFRYVDQ